MTWCLNMRRCYGLIAVIVFLASPSASLAQVSKVQERAVELVQWIGAKSEFDVSGLRPPTIEFRSRAEMAAMMELEADDIDDWPLALQGDGTIFLPPDFRLGRDDWMLLHELVHYVQQQTGAEYRCLELAERAAYELQVKFAHERGGHIPSDLFVRLLTCPF